MGSARGTVRRALAATADLVLPVRCGACHGPGGRWCAACRDDVRRVARGGGVVLVHGQGADERLTVWSAAVFEGALRTAVSAWKDEGRRDLAPLLVTLLAGALSTALLSDPVLRRTVRSAGVVHVVPVPASRPARRRRGGDPVGDLTRRAVAAGRGPPGSSGGGCLVTAGLVHARRVADQSRLTRGQRRANLHGALAVHTRARTDLEGAVVVLVDDVVTTGATLLEAARAVRDAGAGHVVAVVLAATPRTSGPTGGPGGADVAGGPGGGGAGTGVRVRRFPL